MAASESDEQLMICIIEGDMVALGELFERHRQSLYAFLYRLLHDEMLAEDILVDSFLRLYDHRRSYRTECKVTTWLFTIAHNLAIDRRKQQTRREGILREMRETHPAIVPDTAQQELEKSECAARIRDAISSLPDDQRVVIILRSYHDLSYREIADIIGSSEETIRVRAHRARQALKEKLTDQQEETPCDM